MFVDDFAKRLSSDLKLSEPLSKGEDACYWLDMGDELHVGIGGHDDQVFFTAIVGTLDQEEGMEEVYELLLLANLFGQGTGLATLGIDRSSKAVLLNLVLPFVQTYAVCRDAFETYLNDAEYWTKKVSRLVA